MADDPKNIRLLGDMAKLVKPKPLITLSIHLNGDMDFHTELPPIAAMKLLAATVEDIRYQLYKAQDSVLIKP